MNVWVCTAGKTVKSLENTCHTVPERSAVVIHYEVALYQVYGPYKCEQCEL